MNKINKWNLLMLIVISIISCDTNDDETNIEVESNVFKSINSNPKAILLYKTTTQITGLESYGAELTTPIPINGRRTDFIFEGPVNGNIEGNLTGTDYATIHSNGNIDTDVYGTIETTDGASIAVRFRGETIPNTATISDLRETGSLISNHPSYTYLNDLYVIGIGFSDTTTNTLTISFYGFENDPFNGDFYRSSTNP